MASLRVSAEGGGKYLENSVGFLLGLKLKALQLEVVSTCQPCDQLHASTSTSTDTGTGAPSQGPGPP